MKTDSWDSWTSRGFPLFRLRAAFFLGIASLLALFPLSGAQAQEGKPQELPDGSGSFVFTDWRGPDMPVWTFIPEGSDRKHSPIVFVMHGARRDPQRYRDQWIEHATRGQFIVIAPEFSQESFPRSRNYNLGGALDLDTGKWREEELWSFSAIEPLFDDVVTRLDSDQTGYTIYGHSAGSQFVHRYLFFKPDARVKRFIAANAGWYTFADRDIDFPFGLGELPVTQEALRAALAKDVVVLLGTRDTDPNHRSLNRSEGAMQQGPHRFARGQSFYNSARKLAQKNGWAFGWSLETVEGVAHSNAGMAATAAQFVE